jgi:hypothetical protein
MRLVGQNDQEAGRAGKAGQPRDALLAVRDIFVLMPVGPGQDEAIKPLPLECGPQRRNPRRRRGGVGGFERFARTMSVCRKIGYRICGSRACPKGCAAGRRGGDILCRRMRSRRNLCNATIPAAEAVINRCETRHWLLKYEAFMRT